jgi:hypothetical protein
MDGYKPFAVLKEVGELMREAEEPMRNVKATIKGGRGNGKRL